MSDGRSEEGRCSKARFQLVRGCIGGLNGQAGSLAQPKTPCLPARVATHDAYPFRFISRRISWFSLRTTLRLWCRWWRRCRRMSWRTLRANCFGAELRFGLDILALPVCAKATAPKSSMKVSASAPLMVLNLFFISWFSFVSRKVFVPCAASPRATVLLAVFKRPKRTANCRCKAQRTCRACERR